MAIWQEENTSRCATFPAWGVAFKKTLQLCLSIISNSAELLRENKRMLDKAIRELDRERMALQNQEKKVIAEIKKTAKQGQMVG